MDTFIFCLILLHYCEYIFVLIYLKLFILGNKPKIKIKN